MKWKQRVGDDEKRMKFFAGNLGRNTELKKLGVAGLQFALHTCFQQYPSKLNWESSAVISRLALI